MEFWLTFNNKQESLRLPINPESIAVHKSNKITIVSVNNVGEIAKIGKSNLQAIEFSSFFPKQVYPFCQYTDFPSPTDCEKLIDKWRDSGKPIRFIVTDTGINMACCIESFVPMRKDGTGDVYYTLSLKEYRFVYTNSINGEVARADERIIPNKYTVKKGDTLIGIAKKVYGDSSQYTLILTKNNLKSANQIKEGQVLLL